MTGEELFRELGGIDSQLVLNAAPGAKVSEKKHYSKWILVAACFVMIIGVLSYMVIYKIPSDFPIKPSDDSVMWAEDLVDGYIQENVSEKYDRAELNNIMIFHEKNVTSSLNCALLSTPNNVFYGVIVTNRFGSYRPTVKDVDFFKSYGIYAEIINESLYIFVTREQFENLSLSSQQEQEYVFVIANRNAYQK